MWVVYSGVVRGEVGTIFRVCYVGWAVWVHGFCYYMLCLVRFTVSSRAHLTSYLPTVYNLHKSSIAAN